MPRTMHRFSRDELNRLPYKVIVEMWDKFGSNRATMRNKRDYHIMFTEQERRKNYKLHKKFFRWYLATGVPESAQFSTDTLLLITRLGKFAALCN